MLAPEGHVVRREEVEVHCKACERAHIMCFIKIKKKKKSKTNMLSCFDLGLEPFQIRDFKKDSNLKLVVLKEKKREQEDIPVLSVLHPMSKKLLFFY